MAYNNPLSRRQMMLRSAAGVGAMAAGTYSPLVNSAWAGDGSPAHPLAARPPHYPAKAKRVIFFFLTGGLSHVDSFDPKPKLNAADGKNDDKKNKWLGSHWKPRPRGRSGIQVTDLFPHTGAMVDDLCLIRSMRGSKGDHFAATLAMLNGSDGGAKPAIGAWVSYGLGTKNTNLPSYVVFAEHKPYAGAQVWDANFLPAYHSGVRVTPGEEPIPYLHPNSRTSAFQQRQLRMLAQMNRRHLSTRSHDSALAARNLSFETAQSLQTLAPRAFDLRDESEATLNLYGVEGRGDNTSFAWQTLMARRLAERGVRFIELFDTGSSGNWDAHGNMRSHGRLAEAVDRPIAGLLADLKQRGMLEDTLVVCCTEFGRTPKSDSKGRGHHNDAFTTWMAGAGLKGGHVYGRTDDYGQEVVENPVSTYDFHATILHLLGMDHTKLTYRHAGRDFRLTDVHGKILHDLIA